MTERTGRTEDLVKMGPPDGGGRAAVLVRPTSRALVLGSAQSDQDADRRACARADIVVARRRSGGGGVLVGPGDQVWLDVFVPATDPLSEVDVGRATWWLGDLWASALEDAGMPGGVVHREALQGGRWGRRACFAGIGPGEISHMGRKLVGISQRRDRSGARFHSMAPCAGDLGQLSCLLSLGAQERAELEEVLRTTTVQLVVPARRLEEALVARLS